MDFFKRPHLVSASGVHGAGKTSLLKLLADHFTDKHLDVFMSPEMSFKPNIPTQTTRFQKNYRKQKNTIEKQACDLLRESNPYEMYDYILMDRLFFDILVYEFSKTRREIAIMDDVYRTTAKEREEIRMRHLTYSYDQDVYRIAHNLAHASNLPSHLNWQYSSSTQTHLLIERPLGLLEMGLNLRASGSKTRQQAGWIDTELATAEDIQNNFKYLWGVGKALNNPDRYYELVNEGSQDELLTKSLEIIIAQEK